MLVGRRRGTGVLHGHYATLPSGSLWALGAASYDLGPMTFHLGGFLMPALLFQ